MKLPLFIEKALDSIGRTIQLKKLSLVLDLDNTLYCWMDAFAPGLDAQITYIAKRTGLTKKSVKDSCG